ncbi:MAG: hypothetical protein IPJ38_13510 [Dechloromonas sp.]|uniref:Formyl transferase N-terminal domain-containing protein n=1 Tax=Candidatus Dechloromonas phosphorivorans TaxID=2899244 RepID=A0A935KC39_9RHOO|nr:hypothetical protein [Candidatus Dechloromonas phosphorivorans]
MSCFVSKQEHCLYDLLARWQAKELDIEIPCVISNHETFRGFCGMARHSFPLCSGECRQQGRCLCRNATHFCGMSMATRWCWRATCKFLSPELCDAPSGKNNQHPSLFPAQLRRRKPYHQAYTRGVKLIGAICHYVTSELDAGPIIEQDVIRIDHSDSPEDMVRYGKDIEKTVLARGLRYHLEDPVLGTGQQDPGVPLSHADPTRSVTASGG